MPTVSLDTPAESLPRLNDSPARGAQPQITDIGVSAIGISVDKFGENSVRPARPAPHFADTAQTAKSRYGARIYTSLTTINTV